MFAHATTEVIHPNSLCLLIKCKAFLVPSLSSDSGKKITATPLAYLGNEFNFQDEIYTFVSLMFSISIGNETYIVNKQFPYFIEWSR